MPVRALNTLKFPAVVLRQSAKGNKTQGGSN